MIGINIGAMNTSIAYSEINQNGKLISDVILSETSARTIPSCIGYSKSHRMIGEHALFTIRKHFTSTFMHLSRIIGMKPSDYSTKELDHMLTDIIYKQDQDDEFVYKIPPMISDEVYLKSESILAAFINKIKNDLIISTHKKQCGAFTIGVPDFMTIGQIEALGRAMRIAEIDNYNIINESSAITLYYGYNRYKNLFIESDNKINPNVTRYILFVDVGHSKTSFIVSEFKPQYFRVVNADSDCYLGGRDMDKLLFTHLSAVFYKQTKIDITSNKKSAIRLMEQITKARKILTGNQETVISIDCLYEDYDFSYVLKRTEFESLVKPLLDRFATSLSNFYKTSLDKIDKAIFAVEMAGELMRTPCLQMIVKEVTGKELQKTIIVDEAISKGCSLYTALMNNALPLQSFNGVYHFNSYSIVFNVNNEHNSNFLIKKGEPIPSNKIITIYLNDLKEKILRLCFYYLKIETEFIINGCDSITEINVNIEEMLKINNLNLKSITDGKLLIEIMVDNSGKIHLQNMKIGEMLLKLDMNVLCMNPSKENIQMFKHPLIKNRVEDIKIVDTLKKIEAAYFKQDEHIKELHIKKNLLESNVYKLKNKYLEKEKEYEKLHHPMDINQVQEPRSIRDRLESVEQALQGSDTVDMAHLENVVVKLKEIEKAMTKKSTEGTKNRSNLYWDFDDRLKYYTNLIDQEYSKILQGVKGRFEQKGIDLVSEILSRYRMILEASEEKDIKKHLDNFEHEMKRYFK